MVLKATEIIIMTILNKLQEDLEAAVETIHLTRKMGLEETMMAGIIKLLS